MRPPDMSWFVGVTLILLLALVSSLSSVSLEKDLSLTWGQKLKLDKFKALVENVVPHDYMREEIYLIRFLRARNFDVGKAEKMLFENLKWRKENRMDEILNEDFPDMRENYKYYIEGADRWGRPVAFFDLGAYDLRAAAVRGLMPRLTRYLARYVEEVTGKVRELRKEGLNVTQYSFVINMDGFNAVQHLCPACLAMVLNFVTTYENRYPGACDKMYLVNTPAAFEPALNIIKSVASQLTRDSLEVFGTNKREFQRVIFADIARDQLPRSVGGTADYAD